MKELFFGSADNKAKTIARIAIMMAVTVLAQYLTGLANIQLLTGSIVNMFLLLAVVLCGAIGGIAVGIVTPFIALAVGLNPNVVLTPFIALANAIYCIAFALLTYFLCKTTQKPSLRFAYTVVAMIIGATLKFLFMYLLCAKLIFPLILAAKVVEKLAVAWGVLQLFTALLGGVVAVSLSIPLTKILRLTTQNEIK